MADLHRRDRSVPTRIRTGCRRAAGADLLHMLSAEPVTFSPSKLAEAAGALRRPTKRARTKLTRSCLPWRHSLQRAPATTLRAQLHGYTTKLAGVGVARFQGAFTLPVPGVNYENVQLAGDHFGRPRWAPVGRADHGPTAAPPQFWPAHARRIEPTRRHHIFRAAGRRLLSCALRADCACERHVVAGYNRHDVCHTASD